MDSQSPVPFLLDIVCDLPKFHAVNVRHSSPVLRGLDEDLCVVEIRSVRRRFKTDDTGFIVQLRCLLGTTCYINVHPDLITSAGHLYRVFLEDSTDDQV